MKSIYFSILFVLIFMTFGLAQTPQAMKYQAVARDANNLVYANKNITVRITIYKEENSSTLNLMVEDHILRTSNQGLFTLYIGEGEGGYGDVDEIDWSFGKHYLNVQIALEGEEIFRDMGDSPLLSVPYALFAENVRNKNDGDFDPRNELQEISLVNNRIQLSNQGGEIDLNPYISQWNSTDEGIEYMEGNVKVDALKTNSIEAQTDRLSTTYNGMGITFNPQPFSLRNASITRDEIKMVNGSFDFEASPYGVEVKLINNGHLRNESQLGSNGLTFKSFVDDQKESFLSREKLSFTINEQSHENKTSLNLTAKGIDFIGIDYRFKVLENQVQLQHPDENIKSTWLPAFLQFSESRNEGISTFSKDAIFFSKGPNNSFLASDYFSLKSNGIEGLRLSSLDQGLVELFNAKGAKTIEITSNGDDPQMVFFNTNDSKSKILEFTSTGRQSGSGFIGVYNELGELRLSQFASSDSDAGELITFGRNGSQNVSLSSSGKGGDFGKVSVLDNQGIAKVSLSINPWNELGYIAADIKHFRMPHPTQKDQEIWYASLEGPEAGAYERGTAKLTNGKVFVKFSDHFQHVINSETMTIVITPLSSKTRGLAVVQKTKSGFYVEELMGGKGNFEFDWMVQAVRKGFEDYRVIRHKSEIDGGNPIK